MAVTGTSATLRPDLAELVVEYDLESARAKYVARKVMPIFKSRTKNGEYPIFNQETLLQPADSDRAPGGGYSRLDADIESRPYKTSDKGYEFPLDDEEAKQYATYLDFESAMSLVLWDRFLLRHEVLVQTALATATANTVTTSWSDTANATIMADVATAFNTLSDKTGKSKADLSVLMPRTDFGYAKNNGPIIDRIKYTNPGVGSENMTAALLTALFGCKQVLVPEAPQNTSGKKKAAAFSQIWPAAAVYVFATVESEGASLRAPGLGRIILWTEDSPTYPVVETYRDETVRSKILRVRGNTAVQIQTDDIDLFCYKIDTTA